MGSNESKVQVENSYHFPLILPSLALFLKPIERKRKKGYCLEKFLKMQNSFYYLAILFPRLKIIAYVFFDMWRLFSSYLKSHPYFCYTQYIREHLASCFICYPLLYAAPWNT